MYVSTRSLLQIALWTYLCLQSSAVVFGRIQDRQRILARIDIASTFSMLEKHCTVAVILPQRNTYVALQISYVNDPLNCCDAIVRSDGLRPRLTNCGPKCSYGYFGFLRVFVGTRP